MTYLRIFDKEVFTALEESLNIVTRPFAAGVSFRESAIRRLRSIIRGEEISNISVTSFNENDESILASLDKELCIYLTGDYINDRLNSLLNYHIFTYDTINRLPTNNLGFDEVETSLWEILLIDKLVSNVNYILSLTKKETLISDKYNQDYNLFENALISFIAISKTNKTMESAKEIITYLLEMLDGDSSKLLAYRNSLVNHLCNNIEFHERKGIGEFDKLTINLAEELVKNHKNETNDKSTSSAWVDNILSTHSGMENIVQNTRFLLNFYKYLIKDII